MTEHDVWDALAAFCANRRRFASEGVTIADEEALDTLKGEMVATVREWLQDAHDGDPRGTQ